MKLPDIIAHRGYSGYYGENTRASFMYALDKGADGVEADFHLTKDGIPVAIHDFSLKRTTGWKGKVAETTYDEMKLLDYSTWKRGFIPSGYGMIDEQLVTLNELLDIMLSWNHDIKFLLELKHPSPFKHELEDTIMSVLDEYGYDYQDSKIKGQENSVKISFMSFSYHSLHHLVDKHNINPKFITALFHNAPELDKTWELEARKFVFEYPESVIGAGNTYVKSNLQEVEQWVKEEKRKLSVWTVNTGSDAGYLYDIGVKSLTTNYPVEIRESLRQKINIKKNT